jgi:hypothetical protein
VAGDEEALGVAAEIGRGKKQTLIGYKRIDEGKIQGGKPLENFVVTKREPHPEAVATGTGDPFWVHGIVQIEIFYISNML